MKLFYRKSKRRCTRWRFFRKGPVSVYSETQKLKHQGTTPPEKNIIISMEHALYTLNDEQLPELVRIAIFHYYMGYIHPFL